MVKTRCASCGKKWVDHKGIQATCAELQQARKQLTELRILFFVLCLKYIPPETEFTPQNLAASMLRRKIKRAH